MVSREEYRRKPLSYWKRVSVKTNTVLRNGMIEIPAETACKIINKRGGFTLKTEPCKCCGVSVFITKVSPELVWVMGR